MLAQMTASAQVSVSFSSTRSVLMARQIEREMGSIAFLILYFAAGIFGYVAYASTIGRGAHNVC